jgi:hypothetical protein
MQGDTLTRITPKEPLLLYVTYFFLGGGFAALLMYYTSLQKGFLGLYNDSIFLNAVFFGVMAAISSITYCLSDYFYARRRKPL